MSIYNLDSKLVAWIDLTTHCNAGCPQCHRTDPNGLGKVGWLPLLRWDLAQFKNAYPPKVLSMIGRFEICGTWGDPIMVKDILEICKYIIDNSEAYIQLNTNGGMRNEDWWWNLGIISKNRMQVIFDVEGINQEMHSHYRRKVNFETLKLNIQSYTAAGGNAFAHIIIFKHNQDYIEQILDMCYNELEVTDHLVQPSNRFNVTAAEDYIDDNGVEFLLEEATLPLDDPRYNLTAPQRDHKWWTETGNQMVYNKDTSNEKSHKTRNF